MIKINLLSAPASAAPSAIEGTIEKSAVFLDASQIKAEATKRSAIILIFPLALYAYQFYNIPQLETHAQKIRNEISELEAYNKDKQAAVDQIKIFQENEKEFQNRISTLENLSKERLRDVDVINLIRDSLSDPSLVNTWLQNLEMQNSKLTITGYSFSDTEITVFIDKLQKSIFFSRVVFDGANERELYDRTVKEFKITCIMETKK